LKNLINSLLFFFLVTNIYSQWYDLQSTQVTVLLEKEVNGRMETYGTGFLLYNYDNPNTSIVVTCAHLLKRSTIFVSINADSSLISLVKQQTNNVAVIPAKNRVWLIEGNRIRCPVMLMEEPKKTYVKHDSLDIGAFLINYPFREIKDDSGKVTLKFSDKLSIPKSGIRLRSNASIGDEVYFVGFPFGIGNFDFISPLVRSGSIAWFSNEESIFLLDAFSYGGNSGSPIFLKRILSKPGQIGWDSALLAGMIIGHQSLQLENILTQPDPKKLEFIKSKIDMNLGLARCVWSDDILKIAEEASKLSIE